MSDDGKTHFSGCDKVHPECAVATIGRARLYVGNYTVELTCPSCAEDFALPEDNLYGGATICGSCFKWIDVEYDEGYDEESGEEWVDYLCDVISKPHQSALDLLNNAELVGLPTRTWL